MTHPTPAMKGSGANQPGRMNRRDEMKERFLNWLEERAADYLRERYEQRYAAAKATEPECPDCRGPESFCCCDDRQYRNDDMEAAFNAGAEHAYETARRDREW